MQKQEYYNMYESAEYLWWYRSLRGVLHHYFHRLVLRSARILDAGCGTGESMAFLQGQGYKKITGVDLSKDALALCKKRGLKHTKYGSITHLDFPPHSFDTIYSMDVLGILNKKDQQQTIKEFFRVLKPGGIVIVQCAALQWLYSQHDVVVNLHHRFTTNEVHTLFNRFEVIKLSYRFFLLFPLMGLIKMLKRPSSKHTATSDVGRPHPVVNWTLLFIQRWEDRLLPYINFPIGTSVFLVARKPH